LSLGHSVYANSDNNGPWGDALIKEFIPALENNTDVTVQGLLQAIAAEDGQHYGCKHIIR